MRALLVDDVVRQQCADLLARARAALHGGRSAAHRCRHGGSGRRRPLARPGTAAQLPGGAEYRGHASQGWQRQAWRMRHLSVSLKRVAKGRVPPAVAVRGLLLLFGFPQRRKTARCGWRISARALPSTWRASGRFPGSGAGGP